MVEPRHDLLRRAAAIVVGNRSPSCERNYRRFDAGLSLVRQCPPPGSSLADPAGHFALSLEAPARATSSRTLAPKGNEPVVTAFVDKFMLGDKDTGLQKILKDKGITTLVPVGVTSHNGVLFTLRPR